MIKDFRWYFLNCTAILAMTPALAYAQTADTATQAADTAATPNAAANEREILVTGTRIVRNGFQAPTPTTVVSAEQLQRQASPNLIDFLNTVPAFSGNATLQSGQANLSAGAGISSLNLRDLGPSRTLVLINGQRSVPSITDGRVDVNTIPSQLLQRVDVVTGGASAAYGSDAVAGVVNFVLDTHFTGLKGEVSGGITDYGDNRNGKISLTAGIPFAGDRGHFIVSGEVNRQDGIVIPDRPWNATGVGFITNPAYGTGPGQTTDVPQRLLLTEMGPAYAKGGLIVSGPLKGVAFGQGGQPYQFNYGDLVSGGVMHGGEWKAQELRIVQGPSIQPKNSMESFFARSSYKLSNAIEVYAQWNWFHSHYFGIAYGLEDPSGLNVPVTNAFLDESVRARAVAAGLTMLPMGSSYRDLGPIYQSPDRWLNRGVLGAKGDFKAIGTNWSWDAYYQLGISKSIERTINNRVEARFAQALDSVRNPNTGAIICRSTLTNPNDGCVAYNPFGINVNSPTQLAYVRANGYRSQKFTQQVIAASIQGEPFSTWAGPVSVATGAEHRIEEAKGKVSLLDQQGALYDGNYKATFGKYNVTEGFFETVVPLARDMRFAESLDLNAAVRATNYSTAGYVTTWKVGSTWTPVSGLTLRATRSRDIRAPNINELFNAGTSGLGAFIDTTPGAHFGESFTTVSLNRGNPDLVPEKADTTGIGMVFRPAFFRGFQAAIDYWNIDVKGVIANIGTQQIIDLCAQGNQVMCAAINPGTANVGHIIHGGSSSSNTIAVQPFNLARQNARGIDFEVGYTMPLSSISDNWKGSIHLRGLASHYLKNFFDNGIGAPTDTAGQNSAGQAGGSGPPSWRWQASAIYDAKPLMLSLTARGVSSGKYNNDFIECQTGCPVSAAPHITVNNNHIPGAVYWDFAASYTVFTAATGRGEVETFLNIRNITNKDAVAVGSPGNYQFDIINTNTTLYDTDGRVYRVGVRFRM